MPDEGGGDHQHQMSATASPSHCTGDPARHAIAGEQAERGNR